MKKRLKRYNKLNFSRNSFSNSVIYRCFQIRYKTAIFYPCAVHAKHCQD